MPASPPPTATGSRRTWWSSSEPGTPGRHGNVTEHSPAGRGFTLASADNPTGDSIVKSTLLGLVALATASLAVPAQARDQIRIVGSSTVFPFSTAVAESFGRAGGFKTPVVESTGTGGGIQLFCSGAGLDTPDIVNASRRIKPAELETCQKNGVKEIVEVT